jgi:hypothetical protein
VKLDSNGEVKLEEIAEEGVFDIDILIQKLEAYKASVEEAQLQMRRKRSINPREVSEATVAARLKLRLDGRPPASSESHDNSVLTSPVAIVFPESVSLSSPLAIAFPGSVSSNATTSSEASYFDPITPEDNEEVGMAIITRDTARDTWKSSHSVVLPSEKAKTYETSTRLGVPPRSPGRIVPDAKVPRPLTNKLRGNRSAVSSPLASPAFAASDWLNVPRAIGSVTNSDSDEGRKSIDQMSMCPPHEDRIRREIETYTIKDWIETENVKQLEVIASSKMPVHVSSLHSGGESDEEDPTQPRKNAGKSEPPMPPPEYEYGKSTFREKMGSLFHRRTKTDKIIALYYDMEKTPKPKAARTWTTEKASP